MIRIGLPLKAFLLLLALLLSYQAGVRSKPVVILAHPPAPPEDSAAIILPPDVDHGPGWEIRCVSIDASTMIVEPNYSLGDCWWEEARKTKDKR